jgi:hypothetical protein
MSNEVRVMVYENDDVRGILPTNPKDFLAWWAEKFEGVPEELMGSATVSIETEVDYDGGVDIRVEVYYWKKKTPEELKSERLSKERGERAYLRNLECCEREDLARLKAKYES